MEDFSKVLPQLFKIPFFSEFSIENEKDVAILKMFYEHCNVQKFKKGDIIIPAQYDYVSAFQYGYALVYTGNWQKDCNPDCIGFKAVDDTATTYFINQKGEKIDGYDTPKHPKDMFYQGKYYPYPFVYNAFENKLLEELKELDKDSYLEITEKPTEYFPYYRIEVFDKQSFISDNDLSYLINANGQVFKEEYNGVLTFMKDIDWLQE